MKNLYDICTYIYIYINIKFEIFDSWDYRNKKGDNDQIIESSYNLYLKRHSSDLTHKLNVKI